MYSYTATIGRNVPATNPNPMHAGKPMTLTTWEQFVEDVKADMLTVSNNYQAGVATMEIHRGKGIWDGVEEESAKITLLLDEALPKDHVNQMRRYLSELARQYGQDAIALTIGESELIGQPIWTQATYVGSDMPTI